MAATFTPLLEISVEHSICLGGDPEFALAGPQSPKLLEALEGWCGENVIPKCFEDAKSAKLLEMLNTMSEETWSILHGHVLLQTNLKASLKLTTVTLREFPGKPNKTMENRCRQENRKNSC